MKYTVEKFDFIRWKSFCKTEEYKKAIQVYFDLCEDFPEDNIRIKKGKKIINERIV